MGLFTRFQKHWPKVNNDVFITGSDRLFNNDELIRLREEMLLYYTDAIKTQQPRDDYLELLNLCRIFLGGTSDVRFRAPGATHHARWMAKAIYYIFQDQFQLTAAEKKGITAISLFVSLMYGQYSRQSSSE